MNKAYSLVAELAKIFEGVIPSKEEHYARNQYKTDIWGAAQQIYKDYPALKEAARKTLGVG